MWHEQPTCPRCSSEPTERIFLTSVRGSFFKGNSDKPPRRHRANMLKRQVVPGCHWRSYRGCHLKLSSCGLFCGRRRGATITPGGRCGVRRVVGYWCLPLLRVLTVVAVFRGVCGCFLLVPQARPCCPFSSTPNSLAFSSFFYAPLVWLGTIFVFGDHR